MPNLSKTSRIQKAIVSVILTKLSFCEKINVHFIIRLKDFFKFDNFLLMHCCI